MVKYHGTPITPQTVCADVLHGRNALISWATPQDIGIAFANCEKVILDNGAFSFWGKDVKPNWDDYYKWVNLYRKREFFFIPDVIDGSEADNDALLKDNPYKDGVPVWHVAESLERLERLAADYEYIAFGSSGEFRKLGTQKWHDRMNEAMHVVCDRDGVPRIKIHMLRCLNPDLFLMYPFHSGDSTNLAQNHKRDTWQKILSRLERYNSPDRYSFRPLQPKLISA